MAQKAKVLAIKPDRPSLIPRTHTAKENWLSHIVLWRQCNAASILETKVSIVFKNQFYFQILFAQYGRGASLLWVFPFKSPKALFNSLGFLTLPMSAPKWHNLSTLTSVTSARQVSKDEEAQREGLWTPPSMRERGCLSHLTTCHIDTPSRWPSKDTHGFRTCFQLVSATGRSPRGEGHNKAVKGQ